MPPDNMEFVVLKSVLVASVAVKTCIIVDYFALSSNDICTSL